MTVASPKSTSASAPGSWQPHDGHVARCPTRARRAARARPGGPWTRRPRRPAPRRRRCQTRRAVWRCLRGASRSATSHSRMVGIQGPITGAARRGTARGGGSADASAWRTVRRWTSWRRARARTDSPSSRWSLRIRSNSSTLDNPFSPLRNLRQSRAWGAGGSGVGPDQIDHCCPRWGQFRVSYPASSTTDRLNDSTLWTIVTSGRSGRDHEFQSPACDDVGPYERL